MAKLRISMTIDKDLDDLITEESRLMKISKSQFIELCLCLYFGTSTGLTAADRYKKLSSGKDWIMRRQLEKIGLSEDPAFPC